MMTIDLTISYLKTAVAAAKHLIGWKRVYAEVYLARIASEEFVKLERKFAYDLFVRLPQNGFYSVDECARDVRVWAIEAAYRFDPSYRKNNTFSTFLWSHLTLRCMQFKDKAWSSSNYPTDGKWLLTGFSGPTNGRESDRANKPNECHRGHSYDALDELCVSKPIPATPEVVATLSPESQGVIATISADEALIDLARSPHNRKRLSEKSGLTQEMIERAFNEVRSKADRYEDLA